MNKQVEKHESKFITSKDYGKPNVDLHAKFYEYRDKYVPKNVTVIEQELVYGKIIAYGYKKNATVSQFCSCFECYWKNIPVKAMEIYMKNNNMTELVATRTYYNARKFSKYFKYQKG